MEMETAQTETLGEASKRVQAVGPHKKALWLIPDPPVSEM